MKTHIILLRGINVSGQKLIKMEALRKAFADAGFPGARTLIQSGNIILQSEKTGEEIARKASEIIAANFGFEVTPIVLDPDMLRTSLENLPFDGPGNKVYLVFLSSEPAADVATQWKGLDFGHDKTVLSGRMLYVFYGDSAGKSKLTLNVIEKKLGVKGTARNLNTARKLLEMTRDAQ